MVQNAWGFEFGEDSRKRIPKLQFATTLLCSCRCSSKYYPRSLTLTYRKTLWAVWIMSDYIYNPCFVYCLRTCIRSKPPKSVD